MELLVVRAWDRECPMGHADAVCESEQVADSDGMVQRAPPFGQVLDPRNEQWPRRDKA
jgi:hypothetical protein